MLNLRCTESLNIRTRWCKGSPQRTSPPLVSARNRTNVENMTNEEIKDQLKFVLGEPEIDPHEIQTYQGQSVEELAERFAKDPFVQIGEGPHGFPFVLLRHDSGAEAVVHLHGGCISSWTDADNLEMLFVHPDNDFDPSERIRGGLSLAFPQYASGLPGMKHRDTLPINGFMASQHFKLLATHCIDIDIEQDANPGVTLFTSSDEYTESIFPHKWEMLYQVNLMDPEEGEEKKDPNKKTNFEVQEEIEAAQEPPTIEEAKPKKKRKRGGRTKQEKMRPSSIEEASDILDEEADELGFSDSRPAQLQICVSISNTGDSEFEFQAASIADFAVKDLNYHHMSVRLVGLGGRHSLDLKDSRKAEVIFHDMPFTHPIPKPDEELNWVFTNTNLGDVYFCPGNRQYYSFQWRQGYTDTVVAHPGVFADWTVGLATVGAGKIGVPVKLKPNETWHAEFCFRKHYEYWPNLPFEDYGMPAPEFQDIVEEPVNEEGMMAETYAAEDAQAEEAQ